MTFTADSTSWAARLLLVLLVLLSPVVGHAQSLGDVARETRAKAQQSTTAPAKVITNEDLVNPAPAQPAEDSRKELQKDANATTPAEAKTNTLAAPDHAPKADSQRKAEEHPQPSAHDAIANDLKSRAATLRHQIAAVQSQIENLNGQFINRWALPDSIPPSDIAYRELQAKNFNQHIVDMIAEQKKLLADLKAQLESLKEEARHAGVKLSTR